MTKKRGPKPEVLKIAVDPATAFDRLFAAPRLTRKKDEAAQRKRRNAARKQPPKA